MLKNMSVSVSDFIFDEGNFAVKLTQIPPHGAHLTAICGLNDLNTKIAPTLMKEIQTIFKD
jgi:hypothetical protein